LICRGRTSGQKIAPMYLGWKGQSPTGNGKHEGKGTSTRKDLRVLCYEHHAEMLLEFRGEPAESFLYACREPGCFIHYYSSQGYFIELQNGARSESEIAPGVQCPKDGHLMYLAEVRPERKSFRLWKCPECNVIRTNGESLNTAASSG
jgi:hypothetical protein